MDAVVVGQDQAVVDRQVIDADMRALDKRQRPAGCVDDPDTAHGHVMAILEKHRLAGPGIMFARAFSQLPVGQVDFADRDDRLIQLEKSVAIQINRALAG